MLSNFTSHLPAYTSLRRPAPLPLTDNVSGHADTISITVRVRRASWNAMKPRIQCVLAQ
jgi:hypothetical protein